MSAKLKYEDIKGEIEKEEGYKLLSKEYVNIRTKLEIECPKGHKYRVLYHNWKRGTRCPICFGTIKHTYEFIKGEIEKEGYKLLSKEYINANTVLDTECPEGHLYKVNYNNFRIGRRCRTCLTNSKKHSYEYIKEQIEKEGYKLLSKEYENRHSKLKIQCPEGHIYEVRYGNFQYGYRCPICSANKTSSLGEKEICKFVKTLTNENILENDRTQIINPLTGNNLELDIWIPSLNKAIEYNGEYWHKGINIKLKDQEKIKQCKEKGIDLLIIDDTEWKNDKKRCKELIKDFIK